MDTARRLQGRSEQSERGASLILALVFIVVVAVIVGAVSSLALNDLNNTTHFNSATALDYSASSVASLAIQGVRYAPQAVNGPAGTGPCWNASTSNISQQAFNNQTVAIWCTTVLHAGSSQSRDVTMIACLSTPAAANDTAAQSSAAATSCQQNSPVLTLVEAYDDYSPAGTDTCVGLQANATTCGFGASTLVWKWGSLASVVGGLILNTISVSSPVPPTAHIGGTYTPVASATSGDPVTVLAVSSACTVSNGVVSFVTTGTCTLNFTDPGNFNYAPAAVFSQQFSIT
jgi:hypothetical protein